MPTIQLSLREDVSEKSRKASGNFGHFVTTVNQGLELIQRVGGQAYRALDEMFETAGKAEQLRSGFVSLSGGVERADANLAAVQGALRGTVSEMQAMEIANMAMSFGLVDSAEQLGEMTEIGAVLAQSLGQDASKGVADLTLALSRQSPMILDNLGISLKLSDSYDMYAESLGKTASQLTETEKSQAFLNSALAIGRQKVEELGGFVESSATKFDTLKARADDMRVALSSAVAQGVEPMLDSMLELTDIEPEFLAAGLLDAFDTLGATLGLLSDDGFNPVVMQTNEFEAGLMGLMNPLQAVTGLLSTTAELSRESALAAQAEAQQHKIQSALLKEVNAALGTNFTSRDAVLSLTWEQKEAVREYREALRAEVEATEAVAKANEGLLPAKEELARLQAEFEVALKRTGLTMEDTAEAQEEAERQFLQSFETIRKSGKFTPEQLQKAWDQFYDKTSAQQDAFTLQVIGDNTELVHDLSEAFGPGLFSEEDAAFATWIDREKQELLDRQEELMGPIGDAVEGGLQDGFDSVEIDRFTGKLEKRVRQSLLDVWHDEELVQAIAEAMGIFTGQGIGDTGDASLGMSMDDLSSSGQRDVQGILRRGAFDAIVSQGLKGAMNAIESGDFLALQRIREGAQNNATMARQRGNSVHNKDFIESNQLLADLVRDLAKTFGIDVPGFAKGGIGDFGVESLARLHGREAIIPLSRGGGEVREAIMGGDFLPALHALAEETRFQTEIVGELLSDVALNTRAAAENSEQGVSALTRYKRERHQRMLEVSRDPTLSSDGMRGSVRRR